MAIFEPITLAWEGKTYSIPPDGVMMAIAKAEDVITLAQLGRAIRSGDIPLAKIAQAFGAVLRHAGATVADEEIYDGMFKEGEVRDRALRALGALSELMIPPSALRDRLGKQEAGTTGQSSPKRTRSRR